MGEIMPMFLHLVHFDLFQKYLNGQTQNSKETLKDMVCIPVSETTSVAKKKSLSFMTLHSTIVV